MKRVKMLCSIVLCLSMLFSNNVFACEILQVSEVQKRIDKLEPILEKYNTEDISLSIDYHELSDNSLEFVDEYSDEELDNYIKSLFADAQNIEFTVSEQNHTNSQNHMEFPEQVNSPYTFDYPYTTYRRDVEVNSSVPNVGICTVIIYYWATLSQDYYFMDAGVEGSAPLGWSVGTWNHGRGTATIAQYRTYVTLLVEGTITYPVNGMNMSVRASFEYLDSQRNYQ